MNRDMQSTREYVRPRTSFDAHARRAEPDDARKAKHLVQSYTTEVFGQVNREENISYLL